MVFDSIVMGPRQLNHTGAKFGSWTVESFAGMKKFNAKSYGYYWHCVCECGAKAIVMGSSLTNGTSKQCHSCAHGEPRDGDLTLYGAWLTMRNRCTNPSHPDYKYYGARGIKVCERWDSFAQFREDVGNRPYGQTLDRINNDGNYEPSNCRWATHQEQQTNRRQYAPRIKKGIAALVEYIRS